MQVGHIAEIWRYPVKSMGGERIESSLLDGNGILGDRGWAVRDREADETRSARQIPRLLQCAASYAEEPAVGRRSPRVSLSLPGDVSLDSEAEDLHEQISAAIEREVSLTPLHQPTIWSTTSVPPATPTSTRWRCCASSWGWRRTIRCPT